MNTHCYGVNTNTKCIFSLVSYQTQYTHSENKGSCYGLVCEVMYLDLELLVGLRLAWDFPVDPSAQGNTSDYLHFYGNVAFSTLPYIRVVSGDLPS